MPLRSSLPRRTTLAAAAAAILAGCLPAGALHAQSLEAQSLEAQSRPCAGEVDARLAELPLGPGDVESVRIIEKVNLDDEFGPEILGVEGWVRLNSCSGWLVVDMRHTCYVRQTYTLGDCRVEGLSNY